MKMIKSVIAAILLMSTGAKADSPSVHGMLLFGKEVAYASHLPMFHAPHDYQLIMKLKLKDQPRSQTLAAYETAKSNGATLFTLVPEVMDLTLLISGAKTSFKAAIFDGHFERGGQKLGPVVVDVEKIVFSSKLDGTQQPAAFGSYLLFGELGEYFGAHLIKSKPSFDAIMTISPPATTIIPGCGRADCPDPVNVPIPDSQLPVVIEASATPPHAGDALGGGLGAHTSVTDIIYLEENELAQ